MIVLLDAGVLGMAAHPRKNLPVHQWLGDLYDDHSVVLPEIADYEVRRKLLHIESHMSLARLDYLKKIELLYLPITTDAMLLAAQFWAELRRKGQPTGPPTALDADAILAAQAATYPDRAANVVVATENVRHLSRFVPAKRWHEIG